MDEFEHILAILKQVKKALDTKDYVTIKKLSDEVIEHASVHQDVDLISVAVILYALSKLIEREDYSKGKPWHVFYRKFCRNISDMIVALQKRDVKVFRDEISANRTLIDGLGSDLRTYMKDVFIKAKINKASKIYEQGISMEKTAKILGISLWDVAEYTGQKGMQDFNLSMSMPLKNRIKLAEEIFG
jgi:hypothetical protein